MDKVNSKPKYDLRKEIAQHYYFDAMDFLFRFDFLLEEYSKTKRFKCFVDLLMGFECILKSHIILSHESCDMVNIYKIIRKAGHSLSILSDLANYSEDKDSYKKVKKELSPFSVLIRYSIDAYENFFPSFIPREEANLNYSQYLTNHLWLKDMRDLLDALIKDSMKEFSDEADDLEKIFEKEEQMRSFAIEVGIINLNK